MEEINFSLSQSQLDIILKSLELFAFNFHNVYSIDKDSDKEDLVNTLLFYTYQSLSDKKTDCNRVYYDVMGSCRLARKNKKIISYKKAKKGIA